MSTHGSRQFTRTDKGVTPRPVSAGRWTRAAAAPGAASAHSKLKERICILIAAVLFLFLPSKQAIAQSFKFEKSPDTCIGCQGAPGTLQPSEPPEPSKEEVEKQRREKEAKDLADKGIEAYNRGEWEKAGSYFGQALDKNPGDKFIQEWLKAAQAELEREKREEKAKKERMERETQASVGKLAESLKAQTGQGGLEIPGTSPGGASPGGLVIGGTSQGSASGGLQIATGTPGASTGGLVIIGKTTTVDPAKVKGGLEPRSGGLVILDPDAPGQQTWTPEARREAIRELRGQVKDIQEALRRLNKSILSDASQHAEWEKATNEAMRNAWDRGKGMLVDEGISFLGNSVGNRLEKQLKDADMEIRRAADMLSGETDPGRRERLHAAFKLLSKQREEIQQTQKEAEPILTKLREAKQALDTADYAESNPGDLEKSLKGIYELIRIALDNPKVKRVLKIGDKYAAGAGYAQSIVDSSYDVATEAVAWKRINQLNRNSNEYLWAVDALQKRMEKTVKKMQVLEKAGK